MREKLSRRRVCLLYRILLEYRSHEWWRRSHCLNFRVSIHKRPSVDLYRYVSRTRYRTNLFSIWQHGENAANKSLESHSGDGRGLVFVGRVCRSGLLDEISRLARLILEEAGVPCRWNRYYCALVQRPRTVSQPWSRRTTRGFFLSSGEKKYFHHCLPRAREGKRVRRDEGFGKSSRKNGDHVHYRPVNSHSLTTHFLDRHFFFYAGGWNDRGERNFPFQGIRGKFYFNDSLLHTLNYSIQICHRNQFLYLLRFAFNFVINGVDLINRSSIFWYFVEPGIFFSFLKPTGFKLSFKGVALDDAKCFFPDDYLTICR